MVVSHQGNDAAKRCRSREIGVFEHVARTVDAWPLAVPNAEDAIVFVLAHQMGLLGAPQRGRSEVFVYAGLEHDMVFIKRPPGALKLLVEAADRRSPVARHIACRVVARVSVALPLHHGKAHNRLRARYEDLTRVQIVFVVEAHILQRHFGCSSQRLTAVRVSARTCKIAAAKLPIIYVSIADVSGVRQLNSMLHRTHKGPFRPVP